MFELPCPFICFLGTQKPVKFVFLTQELVVNFDEVETTMSSGLYAGLIIELVNWLQVWFSWELFKLGNSEFHGMKTWCLRITFRNKGRLVELSFDWIIRTWRLQSLHPVNKPATYRPLFVFTATFVFWRNQSTLHVYYCSWRAVEF